MKGPVIAILAAVAVLEAGSGHAGGPAGSRCQSALPRAPLGLPASVILTKSCGRFRLGPAGSVVYLGPRALPVPCGTSYWADLTWTRFARGHLLVGRRHQQLWRSHRGWSRLVHGDRDQNGLFRPPGRSSHVAVPVGRVMGWLIRLVRFRRNGL
jgi:hypothetical protein